MSLHTSVYSQSVSLKSNAITFSLSFLSLENFDNSSIFSPSSYSSADSSTLSTSTEDEEDGDDESPRFRFSLFSVISRVSILPNYINRIFFPCAKKKGSKHEIFIFLTNIIQQRCRSKFFNSSSQNCFLDHSDF